MAYKVATNNNSFMLLLRRSYGVASSENVRVVQAAVIRKKATEEEEEEEKEASARGVGETKKRFWMRDPKTGNWIPETHFDDVDAADLRAKLLSKKHNV